ncbi:DUF6221 family protein [Streptosporangium sp. NPDC051023]|uniref:DUF6221 family protein n=1 Tax=Streptosporangium sp. NPDC051023 TaxID=3155410 RepID=UPI00344C41E4
MTDDLLAWLRITITGDLTAALRACVIRGEQSLVALEIESAGLQPHHFHPRLSPGEEWTYKVDHSTAYEGKVIAGGGHIREREAAQALYRGVAEHAARHDPQDTIARCEFELSEIARHEESACRDCVICGDHDGDYPCDYLRRHAYGYRHRPGYRQEWAP